MRFDILHKGELVETKEFAEGSYKIGRTPECEIYLKSPQVSKQHALLVIKGNKAAIMDLGSSNGVFVNGILVRKQRIEIGDEVAISDYKIRISTGAVRPKIAPRAKAVNQSAYDGGAARNISFQTDAADAPPEMSPQDKLLLIMDQKVLRYFYQGMKQVDWRVLLFSILGGSMLLAVVASVWPAVRWGKSITTQEALARAHTVLSQAVRENYRILTKSSDYSLLTIEAVEQSPGIVNAYILDPNARTVLTPARLVGKAVNDVYYLMAMNKITEDKQDIVSMETNGDIHVVAQPIYVFAPDTNERKLVAVVLAEFEMPAKVYSTFEPMVEAALFAMLCAFMAYFLIFKMFSYPVARMQEQLDAALKGEDVAITCEAKFGELETLATVINFAVSRVRQAGGIAAPVGTDNPEEEDKAYLQAVQGFDMSTQDAILVLDKDKLVTFVGKAMEELLSMRMQYAQGQNISDACKDQAFAGTAIEMADRVVQSLGDAQFATLDVNGISRNVVAVAQKSRGGEIRFVMITVKMGGQG